MTRYMPRIRPLALGVFLGLGLASVSQAQQHYPAPVPWQPPPQVPCPPTTLPPVPPSATAPTPGQPPSAQTPTTPTQPTQPTQPSPETQTQPPADNTPAPEATAPSPAIDSATAGEASAAAASESGAGAPSGPTAGGEPAALLGRGDANNRFNLFDNMSALPENRIWSSYQFQQNFSTGIRLDSQNGLAAMNFGQRRDVTLLRMGMEFIPGETVGLAPNYSIAIQDQYIASAGVGDHADAWGNPEVMFKILAVDTPCTAVSFLFGVQPQTSSNNGELHEKTTRFYPGMLFLQALPCGFFMQGGWQFGISDRNAPNTFDYALSLGYWLYYYDAIGTRAPQPWITAIVPQAEILGKHVIANSNNNPFDIPVDPFTNPNSALFREARDVVDLTVGGTIYIGRSARWGTAASFPISGPSVRRTELLTTLTIPF